MKSPRLVWIIAVVVFAMLATSVPLAAQEKKDHKHHHYKLIVLGTLGGPQSWGDPGHNAANIHNRGMAVGVSEPHMPDPFYPNFNPAFASNIGLDRHVYHAFVALDGILFDLGGLPGGTDSELASLPPTD